MGGDRTPRKVHRVDVGANDETIEKDNPKNLISRGKSFHKELPSAANKAKEKANKGDIILVGAGGEMPGEDWEEGARKRMKIYNKRFGLRFNPRTATAVKRV